MPSPGDYLKKVRPGETLSSIPRDAYNAFIDAALAAQRGGRTGDGTPTFDRDTNLVTVRNTSGVEVDRFGVLELTLPMIDPVNLNEFHRVVNLDGVAPTGPNNPFCILLEPLTRGAVGTGVISGIIPCQITGAVGGKFASPITGDTTALAAAGSGQARVVWQQAGSQKRWAYVELPAGGDNSFLVQLTSKTYSGTTPIYSWQRVVDQSSSPPLSYDYQEGHGEINNFPTLSEQNVDLVVSPLVPVGPNVSGAVTVNALAGTALWTAITNVGTSDDNYALSTMLPAESTIYLWLLSFSFSIPSGQVPRAVKVEIEAAADGAGVSFFEVRLIVGGVLAGNDKKPSGDLTTTDALYTIGPHTTPVWGVTLSESQVESTDFGVAVRFRNAATLSRTVRVDQIKMTVYYGNALDESCVVRVRPGSGNYYLTDHEPRWEVVKIDPDQLPLTVDGVVYYPGFLLRYDQETKALAQVRDIYIIDLSPIG